jgi:hypothetical protein
MATKRRRFTAQFKATLPHAGLYSFGRRYMDRVGSRPAFGTSVGSRRALRYLPTLVSLPKHSTE